MDKFSKECRTVLISSSVTFSFLILLWFGYSIFSKQILNYRFDNERLVFSRIIFVSLAVQFTVIAVLLRKKTVHIIKCFFTAKTHPTNLAIFRIVLFFTMLTSVKISQFIWLSQLPKELVFPPIGTEWLLLYIPINENWVWIFSTFFTVCCFTGMIGLFSRLSAALAVITGLYVLGLPNFFGKVGHVSHHLIWFAALLAVSRCGDVLSIDAIYYSLKQTNLNLQYSPSNIYALPLRFVWLLIGIIYFFPGFWKFWTSGFDWALSDNIKYIMYRRWFILDGWTPFFRIDRYPIFYNLLGSFTILFEISFIFLIFFPRLRLFTVFGGLVFHNLTNMFMRISFSSLQACYVSFFDWNVIFHRIGYWLFRDQVYLLLNANCSVCRKTIAALRVFDIFNRITYIDSENKEEIYKLGLETHVAKANTTNLIAILQEKTFRDYYAFRVLAIRIPILWPILPLLYLLPFDKFGIVLSGILNSLSKSKGTKKPILNPQMSDINPKPRTVPIYIVGMIILCFNFFFGAFHIESSWPFSCYPTFADLVSNPEIDTLSIVVKDENGKQIPIDTKKITKLHGHTRMRHLIVKLLSDKDRVKLQALWDVIVANEPRVNQVASVRFYKDTISSIPERLDKAPIKRELLLELRKQDFSP